MASTRARVSSGPSISGSGRIEGIAGMAAAAPNPEAANTSSASASPPSGSLSSHKPIASAPAAVYARASSANDDVSVVICQIEQGAPTQGFYVEEARAQRGCPT